MKSSTKYSPEVRERAVRLVVEHQDDHESEWAAICSIAAKIGCTAETLRRWVRQTERDSGKREGQTTVSVRPTHLPNSSIKDDGVRVFLSGRDSPYRRDFHAPTKLLLLALMEN